MSGDLGLWSVAVAILGGAIRVSVPFLFVSLGECVTEKSGRINLGLEGTLVFGAMAVVSDSAWAAYLKGDRGVFTRRAVRLLDSGEAKDIGRLYDDDSVLREQINRYIHDFESMLRTVLAQREGSPLGVTLLSSDMGKLYVALAQAIERLR